MRLGIMGLKWSRPLEDGTLSTSQADDRVPSLDPAIALFGEEIAAELNREFQPNLRVKIWSCAAS
jgi:hypothetical protein